MNEFNEKNKIEEEKIKKKKKISKELTYTMAFLWILVFILFIVFLIIDYNNARPTIKAKPIIYIYPETTQKVSIELKNASLLSCSYPKYDSSWEVIANPDGKLIDLKTNKELYSLYWEGTDNTKHEITEGFCVKGEDTVEFLEEKLELLGLNYKEKEEFIVYWLPKLESNNYNLIRFESMEEINQYMPLEITPKPDTLIRIMMEFKGINEYQIIPEQQLEKNEREGFTVVEWGGTELK